MRETEFKSLKDSMKMARVLDDVEDKSVVKVCGNETSACKWAK
jgi:hypothetical protein